MKFNLNWNFITAGAPYITISELGLSFNTPSISLLNNPEQVIVGFDDENLIIGVKEYNGELDVKPYNFYSRVKHGWVRIGCKEFVRYLSSSTGLKFNPAIKFIANYDKEEKILYISLKDYNENEISEEANDI